MIDRKQVVNRTKHSIHCASSIMFQVLSSAFCPLFMASMTFYVCFFSKEEALIGFMLKRHKPVYRQKAEHMVSQWSFSDLELNPVKSVKAC